MAGAEQSTSHYGNHCWPSSLTHVCVTRPWCVNMIREYDLNSDTKNTTSRYKYYTALQIIVHTMEITVIFIIWRNGAASYALTTVVCSCVWMGMVLKANILLKISSLYAPVMPYDNTESWHPLLRSCVILQDIILKKCIWKKIASPRGQWVQIFHHNLSTDPIFVMSQGQCGFYTGRQCILS